MSSQAQLLLTKQLNELTKNPVEGFSAGLVDDDIFKVFFSLSLFPSFFFPFPLSLSHLIFVVFYLQWEIIIIGPPDTY